MINKHNKLQKKYLKFQHIIIYLITYNLPLNKSKTTTKLIQVIYYYVVVGENIGRIKIY